MWFTVCETSLQIYAVLLKSCSGGCVQERENCKEEEEDGRDGDKATLWHRMATVGNLVLLSDIFIPCAGTQALVKPVTSASSTSLLLPLYLGAPSDQDRDNMPCPAQGHQEPSRARGGRVLGPHSSRWPVPVPR